MDDGAFRERSSSECRREKTICSISKNSK